MTFLENIFERMARFPGAARAGGVAAGGNATATAQDLMERVAAARRFSGERWITERRQVRPGLPPIALPGWRCDLAAMAEGIIVVPLYARQAPGELAVMARDCQPRLICCGDAALSEAVRTAWRCRTGRNRGHKESRGPRRAPAQTFHELYCLKT